MAAEADALTPDIRRLIETVAAAERVGAASGRWRLEFEFDGGLLIKWHRHELHIPAEELVTAATPESG